MAVARSVQSATTRTTPMWARTVAQLKLATIRYNMAFARGSPTHQPPPRPLCARGSMCPSGTEVGTVRICHPIGAWSAAHAAMASGARAAAGSTATMYSQKQKEPLMRSCGFCFSPRPLCHCHRQGKARANAQRATRASTRRGTTPRTADSARLASSVWAKLPSAPIAACRTTLTILSAWTSPLATQPASRASS